MTYHMIIKLRAFTLQKTQRLLKFLCSQPLNISGAASIYTLWAVTRPVYQ